MIVLVTGGRDYSDAKYIGMVLDKFDSMHPIKLLVHGCAPGADTLASVWAASRGIQPCGCPALWDFYGKRAGARRNRSMLILEPDVLIVFPGGTGTADMRTAALEAGITVVESYELLNLDLTS